ncbi:MAG: chemotaxis response regulator protein-glutamate methylesterase [Agathobacter sp.]|nr:chemotaxis response regulator protein-glutamate methylesterase [Agathobacter sp.]
MRTIKILVVEDSLFFRELLVKHLNKDPELEVVASAADPFEARDMIVKHRPDVMTLDIEMPRMSGLEFLRKLMPQYPMPVVMISSLSDKVFDALNAGAVDFVVKPAMSDHKKLEELMRVDLPAKIKIAANAKIANMRRSSVPMLTESLKTNVKDLVLAIGASTGGTEALAAILKDFGPDIPGTVIVQHMPEGFTEMYANRLNDRCRATIREAKNGDKLVPGQILIAPGGSNQMRVIKTGGHYQVEIKPGPKVSGHCPSVDVLFESVAKCAGNRALGIILTGMGADGANGLLEMRKAGARTIGQDESTCVVYGMPKVAFNIGAVEYQEKLNDIAKKTYEVLNNM